MELTKQHWKKEDIQPFLAYLKSFSKGEEKALWEQRIVNTKMPCLAVASTKIDEITKQIFKGNYIEYLSLWIFENLSCTFIISKLISKIKDFKTFKFYLEKFSEQVDNWASCDTIKFNIKNNEQQFFDLSTDFVKSEKVFKRRIGVRIIFKFLDDENILKVFDIIKTLKNEQEYYVNMAISWLMCDAFIKCREQTLKFLKSNSLNEFCLNKMISKCQDSFRISKEDKLMLKSFKAH